VLPRATGPQRQQCGHGALRAGANAPTTTRPAAPVIKAEGQRACAAACVASSRSRASGARGVCGDSSTAAAHGDQGQRACACCFVVLQVRAGFAETAARRRRTSGGWAPTTRPKDAGNQAKAAAWCSRATGAAETAARPRRTSGGWAPTTRPADAGNQARTAAWCSQATRAAETAARPRRTSGGRQRRDLQRR